MNKIINFIKYHNAFTIILGLVLLATAGALANEDVRDTVIGEKIETSQGIDNSQLISADLDNFNLNLQITNVAEDEGNYYVNYFYQTLAIKDNIWQPVIREKTLTVSKAVLAGKDLGLYVQEELSELADYEIRYLKNVQIAEKEKGTTKIAASVDYTGLIGLVLDIKDKILAGYAPIVQPEGSRVEIGTTVSSGVSNAEERPFVLRPETTLDSRPEPVTASIEATFTFRSSAENSTFQCKINSQEWTNCTSPKNYPGLVPSNYTFQVFATDARGNYDATPAVFSWQIITPVSEGLSSEPQP